MPVVGDIAIEPPGHEIDVRPVLADPAHPHPGDRQVAAEKNALWPYRTDELFEHGSIRIRRDVKQQPLRLGQHRKSITNIFRAVGPPDVRDDDLGVRIATLDLKHIGQIRRITKSAGTGNVEHDDPVVLIQNLQLMMWQKVKDADLVRCYVARRQGQIHLDSDEATFTDFLFQPRGRPSR